MKRCKASKYTWKITFRRCLCKYNILNAPLSNQWERTAIYIYRYIITTTKYSRNKCKTSSTEPNKQQSTTTTITKKNCYVGIFICVIPSFFCCLAVVVVTLLLLQIPPTIPLILLTVQIFCSHLITSSKSYKFYIKVQQQQKDLSSLLILLFMENSSAKQHVNSLTVFTLKRRQTVVHP